MGLAECCQTVLYSVRADEDQDVCVPGSVQFVAELVGGSRDHIENRETVGLTAGILDRGNKSVRLMGGSGDKYAQAGERFGRHAL